MQRKMDLLEQAHGLLCNVPSDGTSAEEGEMWFKLRAEWIERWTHVIKDQQAKRHNARIAIGNEAITRSEDEHRGEHVPADWDHRDRAGGGNCDDGPCKREGDEKIALAADRHRADTHQGRADRLAVDLMRARKFITNIIDEDRLIEAGGLASSPETGQ